MSNKKILTCLLFVSLILVNISCSSIEDIQGADKAETYFLRGEAYLKDSSYEQALEKFKIVKNKFPYSKYALPAELKIADTLFQKEDFFESAREYTNYSELHPGDAKRDYAILQTALCYYNLMPGSEDRDLSISDKALYKFKELLEDYPSSTYFKEALEKYTKTRQRQAEREMYIAKFYYRQDKYDSALNRYLKVVNDYSGLGFDAEALYKSAVCYSKTEQKDKMQELVLRLENEFPDTKYSKKAKSLKGSD